MKFKEFKYERPDFEVFKETLSKMTQELKNADTNTVMTEADIATVRYTINTKDAFYEGESDYWDEYAPMYGEVINNFEAAMLDSPFRTELEEEFSKQYFDIMEEMK